MSTKITKGELARLIRVHAKDGYSAARTGKPASANPWKPETLGGKTWAFGWAAGAMMGKRDDSP